MNLIEWLQRVMVRAGAEWVLWIMIGLSVISVAIILERAWFFSSLKDDLVRLAKDLQVALEDSIEAAQRRMSASPSAEAAVVSAGLAMAHRGPDAAAEAMHGAILADAYRIPWAGCRMLSGVLEGYTNIFKWNDWMQSLSIRSRVRGPVPGLAICPPRRIRSLLQGYVAGRAVSLAQRIVKEDAWTLSDARTLAAAQQRILDEAEKLKRDYPQA